MKAEWFRKQQFMYVYEAEEAKALFEEPLRRIFHPELFGIWRRDTRNIKQAFFNNPDWVSLVLPGTIFDCVEIPDAAFDELPPNWDEDTDDEQYDDCMNRNTTHDALKPLFEMLVEDSCSTIVGVPQYYGQSWVGAMRVLPVRSFFAGLGCRYFDWILNDFHCFSDKGNWGIYSGHDVGALLGGEPEFIAEFLERSGGFDAFKAWTDKVALEQFNLVWDMYYRAADWPLLDVDPAVRQHWNRIVDAAEKRRHQKVGEALSEE